VLRIDPKLPRAWSALTLRLRFGGRQVTVTAFHDGASVESSAPVSVAWAGGAATLGTRVTLVAPGPG
jgi:trehalose/maltose hydrolase-like predicted phosphorylase